MRQAEKFEALVFEVGKVERARAALRLGVLRVKGEQQPCQGGGDLPRGEKARQLLLPARAAFELRGEFIRLSFERGELFVQRQSLFAALLYPAARRLARKLHPLRRLSRGEQAARPEHGVRKVLPRLNVREVLCAEGRAECRRLLFERGAAAFEPRGAGADAAVQFFAQRGEVRLVVQRGDAAQKCLRFRRGDRLFVRFQRRFAQHAEPARARKRRREQRKALVVLLQKAVEGARDGARFQFFRLRFVEHAERAAHVRLVKIAADDGGAEGVHGADVRRADLRELFAQVRAPARVLFGVDARHDRRAQPLLHLPRGEVGEGDGEDARHLRLAREDEGDHAFDHDERFAAARRGGDEHFALRFDGGALLACKRAPAHCPSSPRAMRTISCSVTPRSFRAPADGSYPHTPP